MLSSDRLPKEQLVEFCRTLVRTPSVNGRDPERRVAECVAEFARSCGLAAEILGSDADRPNVIVRSGPPGNPGLLLVAHIDTVSPGDEAAWRHPAFGGEIDDGRLYGRGAIDNKGGIVAALAAMLLMADEPDAVRRSVTFVGVPDEESGATGRLGVRFLHERGLLAGRGAIYVYPGMDPIEIGHRGVLRLTLMARGTAFHSGSRAWQDAPEGHNAVTGLAEILLALEALRFPQHDDGGLFAPFRTVITPTLISGGSGPSTVPPIATAHIDIRLVPGVPRAAVEAAIADVVAAVTARRPPLKVEARTEIEIPPTQIDADAAILREVRAAAHQVLGTLPALTVSGPANESYLLNGFGIPTCIFGPIGANAHAADEYVVIESLWQAAEVYARTACGLASVA